MRVALPRRARPGQDERPAVMDDDHRGALERTLAFPLTFVLTLYLLATSRWGSYAHLPGVPFYIGDAVLALAIVQLLFLVLRRRAVVSSWREMPWIVRLACLLLLWSIVRFVFRTHVGVVALRDFAPYAYAAAALGAYLLPVRRHDVTAMIYTALTLHAAWFVAVDMRVLDPAELALGPAAARVFSTRPDIDGTVCAIAIAFALGHLLLARPARGGRWFSAWVAVFVAMNGYGVLSQHSRAGLGAAILAVGTVIAVWAARRSRSQRRAETWGVAVAIVFVAALVVAAIVTFTPPGQRLVETLSRAPGESTGTLNARFYVYERVGSYLLDYPQRALFGVGFGPDFLFASGSQWVLEGTMYQNVRSPHNYVVGTWARLGLVGAVIAVLLLAASAWTGVKALFAGDGPATRLAALTVIAVPVPAMLGVVLESPFGALPYFWAVGQLGAAEVARRSGHAGIRGPTPSVAAHARAGAAESAAAVHRAG